MVFDTLSGQSSVCVALFTTTEIHPVQSTLTRMSTTVLHVGPKVLR